MSKKLWLLTVPAIVGSLVACGELKKVDDMHGATLTMRDTTKELAKTSSEMKGNMEELYDASRQGSALQLRREALRQITQDGSSAGKIAEAGKYMMSFEFQLWTGNGQDTSLAKRDELIKDAVSEFLKDIKEFNSGTSLSDPTAQFDDARSVNNQDAVFNAMAAALHQVNRKQEEMHHARPDVPVVSLLSLIQDALLAEKAIEDGALDIEKVPHATREILANKDLVVRLLQARQQFIPFIFLSEHSPLGKMAKGSKLGAEFYTGTAKAAKALAWSWTLELDKMNLAQITEFTRHFTGVESTRAFLTKIGVEPAPRHWIAQRLFNNMTVKTEGRGDARVAGPRAQFFAKLQELKK